MARHATKPPVDEDEAAVDETEITSAASDAPEQDEQPEQPGALPPGVTLLEVKPSRRLVFPFSRAGFPLWGLAGTVVRSDNPLLDVTAEDGTRVAQMHQLRLAPEGAVVTPHSNREAKQIYERLGYTGHPYQPAVDRARRLLAEAERGDASAAASVVPSQPVAPPATDDDLAVPPRIPEA